jgi:hypothetical protein
VRLFYWSKQLKQLSEGITLISGGTFNFHHPDDGDIHINDIATPLSHICRFSGQIIRFYSVAQHALNVSRLVPEEHKFAGLMHDTSEAFTNDITTPLKSLIPVFRDLEQSIEASMAKRFGFQYPLSAEVKLADLQMLLLEKELLKDDPSEWESLQGITVSQEQRELVDLSPMSSIMAEELFLEQYYELS